MTIGISMDPEICLILGQVSLSLLYWKRNLQTDICGPGRLTKRHVKSRPDYLWPELWEKMGKNAMVIERQKWAHEKLQLDNARKLRGIYFIDIEDKEFKETIKNARKKLETPVAPAMHWKRNLQTDICGPGRLTKRHVKSRPDHLWPELWEKMERMPR